MFGWWVSGGQEVGDDGHLMQVTYDGSVIAPAGVIGVDDEVDLPGVGLCRVDGPPANYDNGPWFTPGLEVSRLSRVTHGDY